MRITKTTKSATPVSASISASQKSEKIVKKAIEDLGVIAASCDNAQTKKTIQGAIANMSVVLLEMQED